MANSELTSLLKDWQEGKQDALKALTPMVYAELHRRAARLFASERDGHTLQPTAIINEAFLRLADANVSWKDRGHFFALATRMMRRILVDHAKARSTDKRGGQQQFVTLVDDAAASPGIDLELLDLDRALSALADQDKRKAELMELKLFGGMNFEEIALVSGLSTSTIDREIRFSRAWLRSWMDGAGPAE